MPYSGSGVFSPLITFVDGTEATAADQNSQDSDIAGGLTQAMTRAGLASATANIPMGGFKFTGLGMGSASGDSVNFGQITGFAPLAGAAFTGAVSFGSTISAAGTATFGAATFSGAVAFSGVTTVPTVATSDNSTNAASTANVTAKIAAQAAKTPQVTVLTTGSGTYTTPTGAAYLEITDMVGAGSGGGGSGSGSPGVGTAGGATTFGASLLTANGAPATSAFNSTTLPAAATATGGDTNISGALGGPSSVMNLGASNATGQAPSGASSPLGIGGTPGVVNNSPANVSAQNASGFGAGGGSGGNFTSGGVAVNSGWGGNAGAYLKAVIASPAATYAYAIGAAGTGGVAGTNGGPGGNGSGGFIRIVAHFQ